MQGMAWTHFYRPQRSCGQGNVFTGVCLSTGGRGSASVHAGMPYPSPPGPGRHTPPGPGRPPRDLADPPQDQADPPRDQADPPPPGTWQTTPPPGKQTPAYGLRAAGTHPTGMHSCLCLCYHGRCVKLEQLTETQT